MSDHDESCRLTAALALKANSVAMSRLQIPVMNEEGAQIGSLECIDHGLADDERVIADLTEWRQMYMQYFLTQFEATTSRTASWLTQVVIPSPDRMLFMIKLMTGESVGNFGICNMTEVSGELDNLIRGRKGGDRRLIYYTELALLSWMFGNLRFQRANLHVFSDNQPTVRLHLSVGFSVARNTSLTVRKSPNLTEYLLDSDEGDPVDFSYLEMILDRKRFLEAHPWVPEIYRDHWT
jgi:hypothetical protein